MEKEAFEPTGLIPRSIIRTVDRFVQQLLPGRERIALQEYRVSRYQILVSIKSLLTLVFIPLLVNFTIKALLFTPAIEHFWNKHQAEIFLNQYQERRAFSEMHDFSEKMFFESLLVEPKVRQMTLQRESLHGAVAPTVYANTVLPTPQLCISFDKAEPKIDVSLQAKRNFASISCLPIAHKNSFSEILPLKEPSFCEPTLDFSKAELCLQSPAQQSALLSDHCISKELQNTFLQIEEEQKVNPKISFPFLIPYEGLHGPTVFSFPPQSSSGQFGTNQSCAEQFLQNPTLDAIQNNSEELQTLEATLPTPCKGKALLKAVTNFGGEALLAEPTAPSFCSCKTKGNCPLVLNTWFCESNTEGVAKRSFAREQNLAKQSFVYKTEGSPRQIFVKSGSQQAKPENNVEPYNNPILYKSLPYEQNLVVNPSAPWFWTPSFPFAPKVQGAGGSCKAELCNTKKGSKTKGKVLNEREFTASKNILQPFASQTNAGVAEDDFPLVCKQSSALLKPNVNVQEFSPEELRKRNLPSANAFISDPIDFENEKYRTAFQEKSLELAKSYNKQSIVAITNLLGDFLTFFTLSLLFTVMRPELIILKSFLTESVYSLSDTTKSFLLILGMDLLVGFHSPRGWELALEGFLRHIGLPENENFILLFVALFPVFLDTVFKYWIFRYLNKISPSTVVTYHSMIE